MNKAKVSARLPHESVAPLRSAFRHPFTWGEAVRLSWRVFLASIALVSANPARGCGDPFYDEWITGYSDFWEGDWHCWVTSWEAQWGTCYWDGTTLDCHIEGSEEWDEIECEYFGDPEPDPDPEPCGCEECEEGVNPFNVADGNVFRSVEDLRVAGYSGRPLRWTRHHNTVARGEQAYFGKSGSWRHSWQYDLLESAVTGNERPQLLLINPEGRRRIFKPTSQGGWAPEAWFEEKIVTTENGFEIMTVRGARLHFVRKIVAGAPARYEMQVLTDRHGLQTRLEYNSDGYLTRIVDPVGRTLEIMYRDINYRRGRFDLVLAKLADVPAPGGWIELPVADEWRDTPFQQLRLREVNNGSFAVAEVEFYAAEQAQPLRGRAYSRSNDAAAAFDGAADTKFTGTHFSNYVAIDLGNGGQTKIARIRILVPPGQEQALKNAVIEGLGIESVVRPAISEVRASDGRVVQYDYEAISFENAPTQVIALTSARYGDSTQARYRYDFAPSSARPLLVEADDPRYLGRAKRIRYAYHDRPGMVRQEINPATGGVYVSLELDPSQPDKRTVRYSDLRTITYITPEMANGRAIERTDSLGRTVRYEYANEGKGRLLARTDHDGRRVELIYDELGRVKESRRDGKIHQRKVRNARGEIETKVDRFGRVATFQRDERGRVTREVTVKGEVREASYNPLGLVTTFKIRGEQHRFDYDAKGLLTQWTDPKGRVTRYEYDAQSRRAALIDPLGRAYRFRYNERGQRTEIVRPDGTKRIFAYDDYGRKITETDPQGRTERITYDELSRVLTRVDARGGTTRYDYTGLPNGCASCTLADRPSHIVMPSGLIVGFLYDSEGRVLASTQAVGKESQATTTFAYDNDDNVISTTDPLGRVTRHTYGDDRRRLTTTDPLGRVTRFIYDARGNLASVTSPSGGVARSEYDENSRLIAISDAENRTTRYAYDAADNVIEMIDPLNRKTKFEYDGKRLTATQHPDGKRETTEYDSVGRPIRIRTADGLETQITYDDGDRVLATRDNAGRTLAHTYDALGRRLSAVDALGRTTRWIYDDQGNQLSMIYPDGSVLSRTYDDRDRVQSETSPAGHVTRYAYDAADNLTTLTDPRGHSYQFTYDAHGRRTAMVYPDGSRETWSYDLAGQNLAYTTRSGQVKTMTYNLAGLRVSETWDNGAAATPSLSRPSLAGSVNYIYDEAGRLTALTNSSATLTYTYDALGEVTSETSDLSSIVPGLAAQKVSYAWDALGRKAGLIYPDGSRVNYDYDARGRLARILDGTGRALGEYAYDVRAAVSRVTRENGVTTEYSYDSAGQITGTLHRKNQQTIQADQYAYNLRGRRTTRTRDGTMIERATYDRDGQLTSFAPVERSAAVETFSYDPARNRRDAISAESGGAEVTYASNSLNQYTSVNGVPHLYDANGNLINDGKRTFRYDSYDRLIEVETVGGASRPDGLRVELFYDANHRCVLRKFYTAGNQGQWALDLGASRALTYDTSWNLLGERTLDAKVASRLVHGARRDEVLGATLGPAKLYALPDALGSTSALTNDRGDLVEQVTYTAFGRPNFADAQNQTIDNRTVDYRWLFTGRDWLEKLGLNEHRHRYLHVDLGRWISPDPIRLLGGINLYAYVANNPLNYTDYRGLDNPGCDLPNWAQPSGANASCYLRCCAKHDGCYHNDGCTAASWGLNVVWIGGSALGPVGRICSFLAGLHPCTDCNNDVMGCFVGCAAGIDPGGDKYFCPNGPNQGSYYNDYALVPASCWENGVKP